MKKSDGIFRDAERLRPSEASWRLIAAQVDLAGSNAHVPTRGKSFSRIFSPAFSPLRLAAALALASLLTGGGWLLLTDRFHSMGGVAAEAASAVAEDLLDPELIAWQADLGEVDFDPEFEAEDVSVEFYQGG